MRAIFISHGESSGNADIAYSDRLSIALTELGRTQAHAVAVAWLETPALIVTSPCLLTQQTAAPTIARFPKVAVEVWPIEEYIYLEPTRWNETCSAEAALAWLAAFPEGALTYVFGHRQLIQAVRSIVVNRELEDRGKMLGFWRDGEPPVIGNAELARFAWNGARWKYRASHVVASARASNESFSTDTEWPPSPTL